MRAGGRTQPLYPIAAVAAIAVTIVGATMIGGPPAGMAASFVCAATIVTLAAPAKPDAAIRADPGPDNRILVIPPPPRGAAARPGPGGRVVSAHPPGGGGAAAAATDVPRGGGVRVRVVALPAVTASR